MLKPRNKPVVQSTTTIGNATEENIVINRPTSGLVHEIPSFNKETTSYTVKTVYEDNPVKDDETFPIVPTKIIDNFFTDDEIDFIKSFVDNFPERNHGHTGMEPGFPPDFIERRIFVFNDVPEYEIVNDLMISRIKQHFHPQLIIGNIQILTAFLPYRAHGDAIFGEYGWNDDTYAAWTLIIPLGDYDSNTILFNETSFKTKIVPEYIKDKEPIDKIDQETYEKYFTLESPVSMRYFSIDQVYKWKKAQCFAASRYKFHGSDNFMKKGISYKQALVVWTALPKSINILDDNK